MAAKCVKACGLCYPTLPAIEIQRRHNELASQRDENNAVQNAPDTVSLSSRVNSDDTIPVAQGDNRLPLLV